MVSFLLFDAMSPLSRIYSHPELKQEDLKIIFEAHKKVYFRKGDDFFKADRLSNEYYCIEEGLARSYVIDLNGNDITTNFFGNNEIVIDVVSLFHRVPSKETFHALIDCVCWKIEYEDFQRLYHSIDAFSEWGRAWMTQCFHQLKQRSISMITETARVRYLALQERHPEILQQAPLKHIATYLGITDTSLSRIRNELSRTKRR
jgi:CRP/FNR family transcriptional regulator, anaerobic regulatory protein